jgi:FAD/FMN-containing dehydrogenase
MQGRVALGMAAMYVGDPEAGARVMQPLKDLRPAVDLIQPMPYTAFQAMIDPMAPKGFRSYWRGEYLQSLSDAAIDTIVQQAPAHTAAGAPLTQVIVFRIGQGVTAFPDGATAFSHRDAQYMFHPITMWQAPADDDRLIAATRALCEAMRPFSTGAEYLNFTPEDRVRDAYGAGKYQRLVALKEKYDPDNLFRLNANIKPGSLATGAPTHA